MCARLSKRISLSVLICAFFVLPILADHAHKGITMSFNMPLHNDLSSENQTPGVMQYVFSTPIPQVSIVSSVFGLVRTNSFIFRNLTSILALALIIILLLLTSSLYRLNKLKSKAHKLLKNKNKQLRQAKEDAEEIMKAKTQCLSTISHELRTPLNSLTGIVELLMDSKPNSEQWEYLNALKFSSEYLMSLVNNILMLSKLEAKKVDLQETPFNLKRTVDSVINLLDKSAATKNTTINLEYDSNLPEEIIGDSIKISQILINLVGNAVQFTENGHIWIRVFQKNTIADKVEIQFEIEDSGEGIPKEEQQLIFDTFAQGWLPKNRKQGGTGLGLAIVKGLLEVLDSQIFLESELGRGSKFWFILPCHYIPLELNLPQVKTDNNYELCLANKSVLLVEDDLVNQMITKKLLERKQMNCTIVDNGGDAIRLIKNQNFHLVLMDLSIRGIGGLEATKAVRQFNTKIPIIALTAMEIEENLPELIKAGFSDVIPKPFKVDILYQKINLALDQNPCALSSASN